MQQRMNAGQEASAYAYRMQQRMRIWSTCLRYAYAAHTLLDSQEASAACRYVSYTSSLRPLTLVA
jgi:hypothetical protein